VYGFGFAQAETVKPLQGVSFHAGSKDAVVYFLSENGTCKFVLTSADKDPSRPGSRLRFPVARRAAINLQRAITLKLAARLMRRP
jgi:hypothetical protein